MVDLKLFCSIDSSRPAMLTPYEIDGFVYATDGQIAARVKSELTHVFEGSKEAQKLFERVPAFFEEAKQAAINWMTITSLPPIPICKKCNGVTKPPEVEECPECEGTGEATAETDYNSYEVTCKTCDGDGEKLGSGVCKSCRGSGLQHSSKPVGIDVAGIRLNLELLNRIKDLSGLKLGLHNPDNLLGHYFTWDYGDGIIMPLRMVPDYENELVIKDADSCFQPCEARA